MWGRVEGGQESEGGSSYWAGGVQGRTCVSFKDHEGAAPDSSVDSHREGLVQSRRQGARGQ